MPRRKDSAMTKTTTTAARRRRPDQTAQPSSQSQRSARPIHNSPRAPAKIGIHQSDIAGRFRRMTAHQITMAWWLHRSGNITRRQLRVYFAAHEMHEQRKYARPAQQDTDRRRRSPQSSRTHALYRVEEIAALVGGKGSKGNEHSSRTLSSLRADIRHLAKLGLVTIEAHCITFAISIDEIRVDEVGGFWTMFNQIPNARRTVPVPRRSLRALAGVGELVGGSKAVSGVMLAMLIRSLFWHKESASYRVDGRTKASWIVEVFGLSRRAVTDARATLIELGWIEDLEAPQWAMNRWGSHDRINPDWAPPKPPPSTSPTPLSNHPTPKLPSPTAHPITHFNKASIPASIPTAVSNPAAVGGIGWVGRAGPHTQPDSHSTPQTTPSTNTGFATPQPQNNTGSASPCLNRYYSSSTKKNLNTRRLAGKPSNTQGQSPSRSQDQSQEKNKTGVSVRNGFGRDSESAMRGMLGVKQAAKQEKAGSRKKKGRRNGSSVLGLSKVGNGPNIRDIQLGHMQETSDLLELYRQAISIGLAKPSEAGRLDFLALAERAKAHGKRAGALFFWLLREKKTRFITQSEEDAAVTRIRALHNPDNTRSKQGMQRERWGGDAEMSSTGTQKPKSVEWSKEDHFVLACIRVAKKHRISDPFKLAHEDGWTRERWNAALASYEAKQFEQMQRSRCEENPDE